MDEKLTECKSKILQVFIFSNAVQKAHKVKLRINPINRQRIQTGRKVQQTQIIVVTQTICHQIQRPNEPQKIELRKPRTTHRLHDEHLHPARSDATGVGGLLERVFREKGQRRVRQLHARLRPGGVVYQEPAVRHGHDFDQSERTARRTAESGDPIVAKQHETIEL